jgi:hypothetical protein
MNVPHPSSNLYGITHSATGEPRIIEPKTVKVGIGLARGRAMHAYIDLQKQWVVTCGFGNQTVRERCATKYEAQVKYRELQKTAPDRKYPERLPYFTFSHIAASGDFEPDWDAIESHGPIPTEIDIIFIHDTPFAASYQLWSATEKKCDGDGKVALRALSMASTPEEKALATEAQRKGGKWFPVSQCWLMQCPYSRPTNDKPAQCRPMGRLLFQLLNSPRLGGTAVFNTSGYRSISQLFSSIEIFKRATGAGDPLRGFVAGIPLKMVLRPYRITHNGRLQTQYAVSLEFRAENAVALKRAIVDAAMQYRIAGNESLKQLEGMPVREIPPAPEIEENPAAIAAEFESTPISEEHSIPPDPGDDDPCYMGPGGDLEHAWAATEHAESPVPPASNGNHLVSQQQYTQFYELCRRRGMTDAVILDRIGAVGFERIHEITEAALPELTTWAQSWKPHGQGALL